ncbi:MAG TPA: phenoxazinone synthase, partial [Pseudomonas sp.]|nr:phenoxazinone synthase [Pseudomonas sp.]
TCRVSWTTHSAGGALTENDFICAAKVNALYLEMTSA